MSKHFILGTAGHIDHGKTTLIKALTGVNADRLPEEKKRGITIELGFAHLEVGPYQLGVVDVPGHEKFVRNMLAGATGVDVCMLVIAADESVKQQTREHLEILELLEISHGVIVLTKCDVPEPDWIDLVEEDVRETVSTTFLADAPIVRVSSHTGEGLDDLKATLEQIVGEMEAERAAELGEGVGEGPFRMAIDRSFTVTGHGTVVTGSVSSGRAQVGDELRIEPGGQEVRIRGIQNHDQSVSEIRRGQRAAINLAGIHHNEFGRGVELTAPGHLVPSRLMTAQLTLGENAPRPLKHRARVRVHLGTSELLASVILLDTDRLEPGERGPAQFFLEEPAVATWGQPLVLRSESPVTTIGGGRVLAPAATKLKRRDKRILEQLALLDGRVGERTGASHRSEDGEAEDGSEPAASAQRLTEPAASAGRLTATPDQRAAAALYFVGLHPWQEDELARVAGVADIQATIERLQKTGELIELRLTHSRNRRVHRLVVEELMEAIEKTLAKLHEANPLDPMLKRAKVVSRFDYLGDNTFVAAVLARMAKEKRIQLSDRAVALAGHGPQLSKAEQRLLDDIVDRYRKAELAPPNIKELTAQIEKRKEAIPQLLTLAEARGDLVKISPEFYLAYDWEKTLRSRVEELLKGTDGATLSELREGLETTRKYAVPFCEYLDAVGVTKRNGDKRVLAVPFAEE